MLVHLIAGAALGAVIVLMVWIFSGGRPFGEVVGTTDVSEPTTTSVQRTDVDNGAAAPAGTGARLESEPPALAARKAREGRKAKGGDAIQFGKPAAARKRKAERTAAQKREARKARARKRQAVRVVAPPADGNGEDTVAAVPSPASTVVPVASPAPAPKPAKPRTPTYVTGAGEG